jgi:hypothetical protein
MDAAEPTGEGGAAGRSSQPLLLHRAATGPGERGAWRPSRGPPSSATTLPSSGLVADERERGRRRQIYWQMGDDGGGRGRKLTAEEERGDVGTAGGEVAGGGGVGRGTMGGRSREQAEREENGTRPKGGGDGVGLGRRQGH